MLSMKLFYYPHRFLVKALIAVSILFSTIVEASTAEIYRRAQSGDVVAMREMGRRAFYGTRDVKRNYRHALQWFEKAAEEDDAIAMLYLGDLYRLGKGAPKDAEQALEYYVSADENGAKKAKEHALKLPFRTIENQVEEWAEEGDEMCLLYLLEGYIQGKHGVGKDLEKAQEYYPAYERRNADKAKKLLEGLSEDEKALLSSRHRREKQEAQLKAQREEEARKLAESEAQREREQETQKEALAKYPSILLEFQQAVKKGEYWKFEEYLEKGVQVDHPIVNDKGEIEDNAYTPLSYSLTHGNYEGAKILIKHGANINLHSSRSENPIWLRVMRNKNTHKIQPDPAGLSQFFLWLLDNDIHIEPSIESKITLMHCASIYGEYEIMGKLLSKGVNIDVQKKDGVTPALDVTVRLMLVIEGYNKSIEYAKHYFASLSALLKAGADPNIFATFNIGDDQYTRSVFTHALLSRAHYYNSSQNVRDVIIMIMQHGGNPAIRNPKGLNVLEELLIEYESKNHETGILFSHGARTLAKELISIGVPVTNSKALNLLQKDGELMYLYKKKH